MKTVLCCCESESGHPVGEASDAAEAEMIALITCIHLSRPSSPHETVRAVEHAGAYKVKRLNDYELALKPEWIRVPQGA